MIYNTLGLSSLIFVLGTIWHKCTVLDNYMPNFWLLIGITCKKIEASTNATQPNIIVLLADDVGKWKMIRMFYIYKWSLQSLNNIKIYIIISIKSSWLYSSPHVLIIIFLGWADVSWNDPKILMPNLGMLAKEGIILQNHYVISSCSPTRAALLTRSYF